MPVFSIQYDHKDIEKPDSLIGGVVDTGTSLMHFDSSSYSEILDQIHKEKDGDECGYTFNGFDACYCDSDKDFKNITFITDGWELDVIPE